MTDGPDAAASRAHASKAEALSAESASSYDAPSATLTLSGDLDAQAAPALVATLDRIMAVYGGSLGVDLAQVTYLHSVAIGVLVESMRRFWEAGHTWN